MKAEDTVMSDEEIVEVDTRLGKEFYEEKNEHKAWLMDRRNQCIAQAEITWDKCRQETAREIFEELERKWGWSSDKLDKIIIDDNGYWGRDGSMKDWQSLKDKFLRART